MSAPILSVDDVVRLMAAMGEHRVSLVQLGDVKLVKQLHDVPSPAARTREVGDGDPDDEDEDLLYAAAEG